MVNLKAWEWRRRRGRAEELDTTAAYEFILLEHIRMVL